VFVGETDEDGYAGAELMQWYLKTNKVAQQFFDPPGYLSVRDRTRLLAMKGLGQPIETPVAHLAYASIDELVEGGYFFAGSADSVFEQLKHFYNEVGGFGNLLAMGHAGTMSYETTVGSLERFARDVLPRFRAEVYDTDLEFTLDAHLVATVAADQPDTEKLKLP
jgi:alkanesulfonate monooxygenase SsuD/methylene tetrahydromethanopterin reductase-like flavin-dependent oxidoreductase (luciferase family)